MKAQVQLWVMGDGGEQLAVLSGPTVDASFDLVDFLKDIATLIYDYFADKTSLASDAEKALKSLGGDVSAKGSFDASFAKGGGLYNGDHRLASYVTVFFHAWTGDDIKKSFGGAEPPNTPGIVDLGEVRYTRGDFQFEYRFLLYFSLLPAGKYAFAFATGDSGTAQDATIGYVSTVTIDEHPWPTIKERYDAMVEHKWFDFGAAEDVEKPAPDGVGRFRHWKNGSLYWAPGRGAHLVSGAIRDKWRDIGWENGIGYPLTDEVGTPDGFGRFNHFQKASIYWTPQLGSHFVGGAIRERWAALGWERRYLGYPITDETNVDPSKPDSMRYSNFEHGSIRWTPKTGALDYHQPV